MKVIRRVNQRSPKLTTKLKVTGTEKAIPDRDTTDIGLPARNYLDHTPDSYVILIDDLEHDRRKTHAETFQRYREALDHVIPESTRYRASVHFLVPMLEAYYFADAAAINQVLGSHLKDHEGDVEKLRNPKAQLKASFKSFDEVADGRRIVQELDLEHVLADPGTCASLRTLFKWCVVATRGELTDKFQAARGVCSPVTHQQVLDLVAATS